MRSRWRGQPGRLEVWYTTVTDPASGTGVWLHHELVAPSDGSPAYAHGWAAVFPKAGEPVLERFGRAPWQAEPGAHFAAGPVRVSDQRMVGTAGGASWDIEVQQHGWPQFTFPRWAWEREVLPAAQIVPEPTAHYSGVLRYGLGRELRLDDVPGCTARIYGHGNAQRWAWLHADLGGGDTLELVAAVSHRPPLRALRPLPLLALRVDGVDHPTNPLLAALRLRAEVDLPTWRVSGRVGPHRIEVVVTQPPERTVTVPYQNPDGTTVVCRNSEVASAEITWTPRGGRPRTWTLDGTAHAEVGLPN